MNLIKIPEPGLILLYNILFQTGIEPSHTQLSFMQQKPKFINERSMYQNRTALIN